MSIQIFDNFLPPDVFVNLQSLFIRKPGIPWMYSDHVSDESYTDTDSFQFVHIFYESNSPRSMYFDHLIPCLRYINPLSLVHVKANLLTKTSEHIEHGFHIDIMDSKHDTLKSAILYINTNNGYTLFENGEKVNSIENRMVVFDSRLSHTGATCTDEKTRIVLNFNYFD